jgi:hypothetical protein
MLAMQSTTHDAPPYAPSGLAKIQRRPLAGFNICRRKVRSRPVLRCQGNCRDIAETADEHARDLIAAGRYLIDDRDAWSEHHPSARQENDYIERHGIAEYATWHLGTEDENDENRKGRYKVPYGDIQNVHRCGLLATVSRAGQGKYYDIELAVAHVHGMPEALQRAAVPDRK